MGSLSHSINIEDLSAPRLLPHVVSDAARETPSKVWASIPVDATDAAKGYEDVTFVRLAYGVDRATLWLQQCIGPTDPKLGNEFESLAYMGPPDSRYMILTLAAIKAGYQMLFLSPRNSDEAQRAVMAEAKCSKFLCALSMKDRVTSFLSSWTDKDTLQSVVFVVPEQEKLLEDTPVPPVPYLKTFEAARYDPLVSLHTSSTTGLPKLVRLNQGYGFHEDVSRFYPKIDGLDVLTRKPFYGHCRLYLAFPLFHAGGILLGVLKALYQDIILVYQPPQAPLSGVLVDSILRHGRCSGCVIPPYLVEQMMATPAHFDTLVNLDFVQFGSGPMSKSIGDRLLSRQPRCPHYIGTTEIGLLPLLELADPVADWQYFRFHPWSGVEMRPVGGPEEKLFELVVVRFPVEFPGMQPIFELFPNLTEWPTRDLYAPHPTQPDHWRPCGRADDILVLSNGEKFNPREMESHITGCHAAVTGALVVGQGRFQPGLLLEVSGVELSDEIAKARLIDEIWPFALQANERVPKHGQLTKQLVTFSSPDTPFLRTPKFSVRRQPTIALYARQIEEMYRAIEDGEKIGSVLPSNDDVPPGVGLSSSPIAVQGFVQGLVQNVTAWTYRVDPETDLFMLGMDSLHVTRMVRAIRFAWPDAESLGEVDAKVIYANPSISSLANALASILNVQRRPPGDDDKARETRIQDTINRWTQNLPVVNDDKKNQPCSQWTIILTGTTGSLGTFLLLTLATHPRVRKIICLNRSRTAAQQWANYQHPPQTLQSESKSKSEIIFHQATNIGAPFFDLSQEIYTSLLSETTHIIHNAWPVNFNLSLESFESVHLAGVRRLIDFSAQSKYRPRISFVSSLSAVRSMAIHRIIPEEPIHDTSAAAKMGYGESKFVAETMLHAASAASHIPSTIFRVGQISGPIGPSRAAWNPREWFPSLLTSSRTLGILPSSFGCMEELDWIPVDRLAITMVEILEAEEEDKRPSLAAGVYHLINPATTTWSRGVLPIVQRELGIGEVVSLEDWIRRVSVGPEPDDLERPNPARKIIGFYRSLLANATRYECVKASGRSPTLKDLGPVRAEWVCKWLQDLKLCK